MSSQSSAQNYITVAIEFLDGTKESVEVSVLKSGMGLLQVVNEVKGRPVYGLLKDGKIINVREMIKHIPLANGDVLQEAPMADIPYEDYPSSALNTSVVRSKIQKGKLKRDDVIELLIYSIGERSKEIVIEKDATIDQLKKSFAQHLQRPVNEIGNLPEFNPTQMSSMRNFYNRGLTPKNLFGWSNLYDVNRSYDGTTTLRSLGIRTGTTLQEYYLPKLQTDRSQLLRRKVESGEIARDKIFILNYIPLNGERIPVNGQGYHPIFVLKNTTIDELKSIVADILKKPLREISELHVRPYSSRTAGPTLYLGWKKQSDGNIVYNGNLTLEAVSSEMDNVRLVQDNTPIQVIENRRRQQEMERRRQIQLEEYRHIEMLRQQNIQRQQEMARKLEIARKQEEQEIARKRHQQQEIARKRQEQLNDPQPLLENTDPQPPDPVQNNNRTNGGKRKTRKRKMKKLRKKSHRI